MKGDYQYNQVVTFNFFPGKQKKLNQLKNELINKTESK